MSTYGPPRPSGGTYYAASHRAHAAPSRPRPRPGSGFAPPVGPESGARAVSPRPRPGPGVAGPRSGPGRYAAGGDPGGFPSTVRLRPDASGRGYSVPGQRRSRATRAAGRPHRRVPIVVGVLAVVSVLCIGGGAAAYFFVVGERSPRERPAAVGSPSAVGPTVQTPTSAPAAGTPSATKPPPGKEEEVSGDLSGFRQGDCLTVDESNDNRVGKVRCTDPAAQKVLLRKGGTLDDTVCQPVRATFSLSQDAPGSTRDFVLCVGPAG